ncbi:hypothetical protein SEVIR_7G234750v4 [Setaria viridis]
MSGSRRRWSECAGAVARGASAKRPGLAERLARDQRLTGIDASARDALGARARGTLRSNGERQMARAAVISVARVCHGGSGGRPPCSPQPWRGCDPDVSGG